MEETKDPQRAAMDYATFLINNTTYKNLEGQAVVLDELIELFGDSLRSQLITQFCRTRALCEGNNLELYAEMIRIVQDEKLCDQIIVESVKVVNEILDAEVVNAKVKEKLRNIGSFIGLLTLARDIPIQADIADLKRMLIDAMATKNPQRICLMVVLITHVLKYCERSTIFKKDCTWVSRIITLLKAIHKAEGTDVFVCLEIERYLENLDKPASVKQSPSDDNLMNELTAECEEKPFHQFEFPSPSRAYTPNYYDANTFDVDLDSDGNQVVPRMTHPPVRTYTMRTPDRHFSMQSAPIHSLNAQPNTPHRSGYMPNQPHTPLNHHSMGGSLQSRTHQPLQFSTPQRPEVTQQFAAYHASMPGTPIARRELFSSNFPSPQSSNYSSDQHSQSSTTLTGAPIDGNRDEMFIQLMIARMNFEDTPILYTNSRAEIVESFTNILKSLEVKFLGRIRRALDSFCNYILMRDLAFCTDEKQIRQCYLVAIRSFLLSAFQPQTAVAVVMQQFAESSLILFRQLLESLNPPVDNPNLRSFYDNSVPTFVAKNHQIVIDCMVIKLNRRSVMITEEKIHALFKSTDRMSMAFPSFVGSPRNDSAVNERLPERLRRTYGPLDNEEMRVYADYDSMARTLQQFIEQGTAEDVDAQPQLPPINTAVFEPLQIASQDQSGLHKVTTVEELESNTKFISQRQNRFASNLSSGPSSPANRLPMENRSNQQNWHGLVDGSEEASEYSKEFYMQVENIFRDWFSILNLDGDARKFTIQQLIESIFLNGFVNSFPVTTNFVDAAWSICQRIGDQLEEAGNENADPHVRTQLFEKTCNCACSVALMFRLLALRQRAEYGVQASIDVVEATLSTLLKRIRSHVKEISNATEFALAIRFKFIIKLFSSFANFQEKDFSDPDYCDLFVKTYANTIYKFNLVESPELLYCYVALILDRPFLTALNRMQCSNKSIGFLNILVIQVSRLLANLSRTNRLHTLSHMYKKAIMRLMSQLTDEYPHAFSLHYIAYSEILPPMALHYRNQVLCCVPPNTHVPSTVADFQAYCATPEMNSMPEVHVAPISQRLPDEIVQILSKRMEAKEVDGFPQKLVELFHSNQTTENRSWGLSSAIVFVGQMSIAKIKANNSIINSVALTTNNGQRLLTELVEDMDSADCYSALVLMIDHLRYPNAFTAYFGCLILNMFRDTTRPGVREIIARILLERFMPGAPYPWGLRAVYSELLSNSVYNFLDQPFHKKRQIDNLIKRAQQILAHPEIDFGPALNT
ncbi:hypothetical protein M3Y95_00329400 [Aphelenchoides besseyi]|nr:hypothetical protein M3Y95_00329400 [Aphelenchoides besseyi]